MACKPRVLVTASPVDAANLGLLAAASVAAGAINSVAGGGTIVSFPAALAAGLPPVLASATNTVALGPGSLAAAWAYRRELEGNTRLAVLLAAPAVGGSVLGAALLLAAPAAVFDALVPWLVLGATCLLFFSDAVGGDEANADRPRSRARTTLVAAGFAVAAVYGGYFGAGMGIISLALLSRLHRMNIHQMNAMKTVIVGAINACSAVYFLARGAFDGPAAVAMTAGMLAGGFGGASVARRVNAKIVRGIVVLIGVGLSAVLAWRRWA